MNLHGFGYTFPFPIVCTKDVSAWPSIQRKIDGINVEVFPPFLSGSNVRITNDFLVNDSPSFRRRQIQISGVDHPPNGFRTVPQCFDLGPDSHPPQVETNAIQLEIQTSSEQRAEKIQNWLIRSGLRSLKRESKQFWIEHPAVYFEGFKRLHYRVENGLLDHGIWSTSTVFSGNLRMLVVDFARWKSAWLSAKKDYNTDKVDSLLLAEHQLAGGFLFDATMSCALALEKCKYELWEKLHEFGYCSKAELKAAHKDTQKPERYFGELIPTGFDHIKPSNDQLLKISKVWITRGVIAHGKEREISKVLGKDLDSQDVSKWIDALWEIGLKLEKVG